MPLNRDRPMSFAQLLQLILQVFVTKVRFAQRRVDAAGVKHTESYCGQRARDLFAIARAADMVTFVLVVPDV